MTINLLRKWRYSHGTDGYSIEYIQDDPNPKLEYRITFYLILAPTLSGKYSKIRLSSNGGVSLLSFRAKRGPSLCSGWQIKVWNIHRPDKSWKSLKLLLKYTIDGKFRRAKKRACVSDWRNKIHTLFLLRLNNLSMSHIMWVFMSNWRLKIFDFRLEIRD